jgi:hypothetical protein
MREHPAVTAQTVGSGTLFGAKTQMRFHRQEQCNHHHWYDDHSAVICDTEFIGAIVYLTSHLLMIRDHNSAFRSFLAVQSGW